MNSPEEYETLDASGYDLFHPERWPMLARPRNDEEFAQVILEVMRTESGRLMLNGLVYSYMLQVDPSISAERAVGRHDVVRQILDMLGRGLWQIEQRRQPVAQQNPWR